MNCLIKSSRLNHKNFKNVFKTARYLSNQTLPQEVLEQENPNELFTRVIEKKPQKPPFMKNIFLGYFDNDILGFPEVLNNEELKKLNEKVSVISNYLSTLDISTLKTNKLPTEIHNQLNNLQLFGLQAPQISGGLELTETENCRILEVIAKYSSLSTRIINHQYMGVKAILENGSITLKNKYLSRLSRGEHIAAFCLVEEDNPDSNLVTARAKLSADGKTLVLNGHKSWIVNGSQDVYIVLACTEDDNSASSQDKMSLLVVEKNFGGVTSKPCQSVGLKYTDMCDVTFKDTPIPIENVLGKGSDSLNVITPLLSGLRLSTGPSCIALLKKLVSQFSKSALQTQHGSKYLSDADFIKDKIAQINLNLYAVESMTYMTAGLLDRYEKQDCDLESAIIKVFCSEKCMESVQQCVALLGPSAYIEGNWLNELYNDALGYMVMNETNGSLRMVISLLGLQYAGSEMNMKIKKLRNPFFHPAFIVKNMWTRRRQYADNPKLELHLENFLHPSLTYSGRWLEYCVYRLQYATETLLINYGPKVVEQHMELRRLTDVAMNVYAMASVLSRASRSYCIGLQNADYEILLANAFCLNAMEQVKNAVLEISRGRYGTNDINYQKIASRAFKFNGYFAEHALTKNF